MRAINLRPLVITGKESAAWSIGSNLIELHLGRGQSYSHPAIFFREFKTRQITGSFLFNFESRAQSPCCWHEFNTNLCLGNVRTFGNSKNEGFVRIYSNKTLRFDKAWKELFSKKHRVAERSDYLKLAVNKMSRIGESRGRPVSSPLSFAYYDRLGKPSNIIHVIRSTIKASS